MADDSSKKSKKDLIIKIILVIIIILLLLHNCSLIRKKTDGNNNKTPTGNVDIFEIQCNKNSCDTDIKKDDNNENNDNDNTLPVNGGSNNNTSNDNSDGSNNSNSSSTTTDDGKLEITDKDITWSSTNNLRIFSNPVYNMNQKIAPESTNVYQFVINNNTKYDILYNINFVESNTYNINMKYKLKLGNVYIAGDENNWVSYDELKRTNINLSKSNKHTYYLEWKWVSSDNDTNVGKTINAGYNLSIEIKAEQNNG